MCVIPEGVEVRLSAELIRPLIVSKKIYHISVGDKSRYKNNFPEGMLKFSNDCRISSIDVKGKFMYFTFDNGWYLFNTFGMSGQWSPIPGKHPCLIIQFEDGEEEIIFNDPRHFGTIKFTNNKKDLTDKLNDLGWDPMQMSLENNFNFIVSKLSRSSKTISENLMNQTIFAGVGNYIKAESLYRAKISPWRNSCHLTNDEIKYLCQAVVDVMNESYQHQGATIQTYKTPYGEEGRYSSCFKVYGKKKDPLGNVIVAQTTPDKRTTHWCPSLQK